MSFIDVCFGENSVRKQIAPPPSHSKTSAWSNTFSCMPQSNSSKFHTKTSKYSAFSSHVVCNNCNKSGHLFHQCKMPITSYGIVAYRICSPPVADASASTESDGGVVANAEAVMATEDAAMATEGAGSSPVPQETVASMTLKLVDTVPEYQYLMICRKDTFGYISFVRGKYTPYDLNQIMSMINEMTVKEKDKIVLMNFDQLWKDLWGTSVHTSKQHKFEEMNARKRFEALQCGVYMNNRKYTVRDLVARSSTAWTDPEWEFPKGRREQKERDVDCAMREFEEETGIQRDRLGMAPHIIPVGETYVGSNQKLYKHLYFVGRLDDGGGVAGEGRGEIDLDHFQHSEVSKMEWKNIHECLACIRSYHGEKKNVIQSIHDQLIHLAMQQNKGR